MELAGVIIAMLTGFFIVLGTIAALSIYIKFSKDPEDENK